MQLKLPKSKLVRTIVIVSSVLFVVQVGFWLKLNHDANVLTPKPKKKIFLNPRAKPDAPNVKPTQTSGLLELDRLKNEAPIADQAIAAGITSFSGAIENDRFIIKAICDAESSLKNCQIELEGKAPQALTQEEIVRGTEAPLWITKIQAEKLVFQDGFAISPARVYLEQGEDRSRIAGSLVLIEQPSDTADTKQLQLLLLNGDLLPQKEDVNYILEKSSVDGFLLFVKENLTLKTETPKQ